MLLALLGAAAALVAADAGPAPCPGLANLDDTIVALAAAPAKVGSLGRLRAYVAAQARLEERAALACAKDSPPPVAAERLTAQIVAQKKALRLRVLADGPGAGLPEALSEALRALGYDGAAVDPRADGVAAKAAAFDVEVRLRTRVEPEIGPAQKLAYAQAVLRIVLTDGLSQKPLAEVESAYRYGGTDPSVAGRKAEAGLSERARTNVAKTVDALLCGVSTP